MEFYMKLINIRMSPSTKVSFRGRLRVLILWSAQKNIPILHAWMILINFRMSPSTQVDPLGRWKALILWSSKSQNVPKIKKIQIWSIIQQNGNCSILIYFDQNNAFIWKFHQIFCLKFLFGRDRIIFVGEIQTYQEANTYGDSRLFQFVLELQIFLTLSAFPNTLYLWNWSVQFIWHR